VPAPLPDLLIDQYHNAPNIHGVVEQAIVPTRDATITTLERIDLYSGIDAAEGQWLDHISTRLGMERPATTDPAPDERFGFDEAGSGFDQAPFRGVAANDAVYPLPDDAFRRLLKARTVLLATDGTVTFFARAVREIDPTASVQDRRDMSVRVVTNTPALMELAETAGALPRTAGVAVDFVDRQRFGFDEAGVGFDQGPFTGGGS